MLVRMYVHAHTSSVRTVYEYTSYQPVQTGEVAGRPCTATLIKKSVILDILLHKNKVRLASAVSTTHGRVVS